MSMQGRAEFDRRLTEARERIQRAVGAGLYTEASRILSDAIPKTPLDKGPLRASGYVTHPVVTGNEVVVEVGFGGPAAKYAVTQHEDTSLHHPEPGTEAHFLRNRISEHKAGASDRVASDARRAFESNAGALPGPFPEAPR